MIVRMMTLHFGITADLARLLDDLARGDGAR
jgi:hypothetical protein